MKFKGTKEVFAVEYAGTIFMNEAPYYESYNVLDMEHVGEEVAWANAKLYEAAPELLEACQKMITAFESAPKDWLMTKDVIGASEEMNKAINKALGQ